MCSAKKWNLVFRFLYWPSFTVHLLGSPTDLLKKRRLHRHRFLNSGWGGKHELDGGYKSAVLGKLRPSRRKNITVDLPTLIAQQAGEDSVPVRVSKDSSFSWLPHHTHPRLSTKRGWKKARHSFHIGRANDRPSKNNGWDPSLKVGIHTVSTKRWRIL